MRLFGKLPATVAYHIAWQRRRRGVRASFTHVAGPRLTRLAPDEAALVIVGRDAGYFLPEHVARHRVMGVRHVVYIDNGSTDRSVEIMSAMPDTTVATCSAAFHKDEYLIRYFASTLYLRGGWRLAIDPDEIFDYPGSDRMTLPDLLRHLNRRRQTGLVAQMLEMVPPGPLGAAAGLSYAEAIARYNRYDLRNITAEPYHGNPTALGYFLDRNRLTNPDVRILFGGLRRTVFGEDCCLTKHALFRMGARVVPFRHPHVTTGLVCADFTAVLKHYKFAGGVSAREEKLLREGRVAHDETRQRFDVLSRAPEIDLGREAAFADPTPDKLLAQGFLVLGPQARADLGIAPVSAGRPAPDRAAGQAPGA